MTSSAPHPTDYMDTCAACGVILDTNRAGRDERRMECEAVRQFIADHERNPDEVVCVSCCAGGIPAVDNEQPLDCGGDCTQILAKAAVA